MLKSDNSIAEQIRDHAEIYLNKITEEQSKYIALHVGIFWCIGTFRIKNEDEINVMLDSKSMYEYLTNEIPNKDDMISKRVFFINQLINQRKLKVNYKYEDDNLAKNLIAEELKTSND